MRLEGRPRAGAGPRRALPKRANAAKDANEHAGSEVRAHMARRGLKACDMAATLGVCTRAVYPLLQGRRPWRLHELQLVARWLGVGMSDLLPVESDRTPSEQARRMTPVEQARRMGRG